MSISTLTPVLARGPRRARVDNGAGRRHVDRHGELARTASVGRAARLAALHDAELRNDLKRRARPRGPGDLVSALLVRELTAAVPEFLERGSVRRAHETAPRRRSSVPFCRHARRQGQLVAAAVPGLKCQGAGV